VLVHRVNADHRLLESNYGNDAASMLLDLRWRKGLPIVRILRSCPDTLRCDRPIARAGAGRRLRHAATEARIYCPLHRLP
jgi:hypothetical protein